MEVGDLVVDVLQGLAVLIRRPTPYEVVDPDQDRDQVGLDSLEVGELVFDQVQRGEAVDGWV